MPQGDAGVGFALAAIDSIRAVSTKKTFTKFSLGYEVVCLRGDSSSTVPSSNEKTNVCFSYDCGVELAPDDSFLRMIKFVSGEFALCSFS